jgi:hypothetical protein
MNNRDDIEILPYNVPQFSNTGDTVRSRNTARTVDTAGSLDSVPSTVPQLNDGGSPAYEAFKLDEARS